jgi:hypothetical protein
VLPGESKSIQTQNLRQRSLFHTAVISPRLLQNCKSAHRTATSVIAPLQQMNQSASQGLVFD